MIFRRRGCSGYERRLERGAALGDGEEAADILDVDKIRGSRILWSPVGSGAKEQEKRCASLSRELPFVVLNLLS